MKIKLLLLILGLSFFNVIAQFGPQQIITNTSPFPSRSIPLDIDNDGYIDVLTSSDLKLKWFRNLDGLGNFSDEILISENIAFYLSVDFVDFDSDGDKDLVYLENNPRKLEWLENLDGQGNFGPVQVILENQIDFLSSVNIKDIDNDGDYDLIIKYTNTFIDRIVWYENLDGLGEISEEILLIGNVKEVYPPLVVDIDNDGNLDILTSHENNGPAKIVWYKNLGNVIFGPEQEVYQFEFFQSDWTSIFNIQFVNINTNQLKDITITSYNDNFGTFEFWIENLDGQGTFSTPQNIPNLIGSYNFYDLDNDGDNDILGGYIYEDIFYWMENENGFGDFSERNIISTEIVSLSDTKAADFNNDGLLDVVSASSGDNKVAWYENGVLGIEDNKESHFYLYPNPTNGKLNINTNQEITLIEVYNTIGQKILETRTEINLTKFESGIYFVKIKDSNGFSEVHKIIKE